jgi:hypothetical protein
MKRAIIYNIIFIFLSSALAFAQIHIKAEVDKTSISTGEVLTYKLTIASTEKNTPPPQIPEFKGFNIISQAQSSTISLSGKDTQTIVVYAFILAPQDTGKFQIEPSKINLAGKTYYTDSFEIEVTEPLPLPEESIPESEQPKITL